MGWTAGFVVIMEASLAKHLIQGIIKSILLGNIRKYPSPLQKYCHVIDGSAK